MRRIPGIITVSVILLSARALSQPQNQPLLFHTIANNNQPLPICFGPWGPWGTPVEEGDLIQIVCAGADHLIQPPVTGIGVANVGLPTGDDFLADPVQNNVQLLYVNGLALWGPGYGGCLYSMQAVNCLAAGEGMEPVINVGDYIYLRAFNAPDRIMATDYSDMKEPISPYPVILITPGIPYEVYCVEIWSWYPVEMLSFTAAPGNNFIILEWVTASESENHHFNLYRDEVKIVEVPTQAIGGESSALLTYTFKDDQVVNGVSYSYRITDVDINGVESEEGMEIASVTPAWNPDYVVAGYELHQNYPNPFNPGTTIEYDLPESGVVYLTIYNLQGQVIAKIIDGEYQIGPMQHMAFWNAEGLASGVYFYELKVGDFKAVKKMVLAR